MTHYFMLSYLIGFAEFILESDVCRSIGQCLRKICPLKRLKKASSVIFSSKMENKFRNY